MASFALRPLLFSVVALSNAQASPAGLSSPPDFPDTTHVPNGCYLSTFAYLKKFRAAHPEERGEVFNLVARFADRRDQPHTLAIVSWRGGWWLRDEYFGVFPLGVSTELDPESEAVRKLAKLTLEMHALNQMKRGSAKKIQRPPTRLGPEERLQHVVAAGRIVGEGSEIYLLRGSSGGMCAFLFFHPQPGCIAVYDPVKGTASSDCTSRNGLAVVRAVALKLGYAAGDVAPLGERPECSERARTEPSPANHAD